MLKKKINGVWQNCYVVKNKVSGSWVDIKRDGGKYLRRYTNGSWNNIIYYPTLDLMNYDLVTSRGSRTNSLTGSTNSVTLKFTSYYDLTSKSTAEANFGHISVKSGDVITASFSGGTSGNHYYLDRLEARAYLIYYTNPDNPTNYNTITSMYYYIQDADYTNESSRSFSYTFTRAYDYVGFRLYVLASDTSASTTYASGSVSISYLGLNNETSLYLTPIDIEK